LPAHPIEERKRHAVAVRGVVQGVGFRPFVFRLAHETGLSGFIGNNTDGVTIEIEGPEARVREFLERLRTDAPPMARIDSVVVEDRSPSGESEFRIVSSQVLGQVSTGIPADAATCPDCLRELLDPADRRHRYPFINCTNCGPRFTITRRIPYDRPQTSMAVFPMCPQCQAEYDDPLNRRFHAQPNACRVCGPRVWLTDTERVEIPADDPITACIDRLMDSEIMAIKGIGGFHLAVDATIEPAVMRLRERKHRYGKPLAVMVRDIGMARKLCELTSEEEALMLTPARSIVLARALTGNGIADSVAPGIPWLGIYLPYAPLQHLLFADTRVRALVMTSANLSEEPITIDNDEAQERLKHIADAFLLHNREILQRCDDSVQAVVDGAPQVIRRARGFVPLAMELPLALHIAAPPLLAVGGHLKSVFALARGQYVYQSQHLGDLENLTGIEFFEHALDHLMRTFEIQPQVVVHDLHPGYLSTSWAKEWATARSMPLIGVQHHHAHIAGCMAEHGLEGPVIGLSLDGTGYGSDGRIWGGEVLIARLGSFERFAHLDYVPMPGGDAAVREPWRMALAHLHAAGFDVSSPEMLSLLGAIEKESRLLMRMMERALNAPLTSSLGRLFDAVAAVVLNRRTVDYEAQAAIELEGVAVDEPDDGEGYEVALHGGDWQKREPLVIKVAPLWEELLADLKRGAGKPKIAARFHAGVANGFVGAAEAARSATGIRIVAMSGGVMHNRRLARLLRSRLEWHGFQVYQHRRVSPGDGGLSYGQAAVAAAILAKGGPPLA
jgi:hydrogenase maturation protein HypF